MGNDMKGAQEDLEGDVRKFCLYPVERRVREFKAQKSRNLLIPPAPSANYILVTG